MVRSVTPSGKARAKVFAVRSSAVASLTRKTRYRRIPSTRRSNFGATSPVQSAKPPEMPHQIRHQPSDNDQLLGAKESRIVEFNDDNSFRSTSDDVDSGNRVPKDDQPRTSGEAPTVPQARS
jgi:hypothetical protein